MTLSYGIEVITPAVMLSPPGSAPGELGLSIDATDDPLVCLDDRDPIVLALSRSPPKYFPSSLAFLLSFLLLLEKNDFPPDDCLDLLSPADILGCPRIELFVHRYANGSCPLVLARFLMRLASNSDFELIVAAVINVSDQEPCIIVPHRTLISRRFVGIGGPQIRAALRNLLA